MDDVWLCECLGEPERNADTMLEERLDASHAWRSRRLTGEFLVPFPLFVLSAQFSFLVILFLPILTSPIISNPVFLSTYLDRSDYEEPD